MSSGSGGTNTVTQSSQPPQNFQDALSSTLGTAQGVAATPLTQYPAGTNASNLVAPLNSDQTSAISEVNNAVGIANPYINAASADLRASRS